MGEEKQEGQKATWDGHSSSAEAAARAARANISLNDQIEQIHKQKGLLPERAPERPPEPPKPVVSVVQTQPQPTMVPQPPMMVSIPVRPVMMAPTPVFTPVVPSRPPMVPMGHAGPSMTPAYIPPSIPLPPRQDFPPMDEPPNKRQKTEENLIPEDIFLQRNMSPVAFKVLVPAIPDKPEWKMNGQMMGLSLSLTDTVNTIKAKIFEELGMPQGKQKLQHENIFLKDANTLAFYNVTPGTMLQLQLKERGGRKK